MNYRLVSTIKVQFRDVDSLKHVNNAVYLSYLETARMELYEQTFGPDCFERFPFILAEITVRFLAPAALGEMLDLLIRVSDIGQKSYRFQYLIRSRTHDRTVCEAESVQVFYDYEKERSFEVPEKWKQAIEAL